MTQVNLDNEHVSTGISGSEFFVTPKAVDAYKWENVYDNNATVITYDSDTDTILIGFSNGDVKSINRETGNENFTISINNDPVKDIVVNSQYFVALSGGDLNLYEKNGTKVWNYYEAGAKEVSLVNDGVIYTYNNGVELLSYADASEIRTNTSYNSVSSISALENGNEVFIGDYVKAGSNGSEVFIRRIDATDSSQFGNVVWENSWSYTDGEAGVNVVESGPNDYVIISYYIINDTFSNRRNGGTVMWDSDGNQVWTNTDLEANSGETQIEYNSISIANDGSLAMMENNGRVVLYKTQLKNEQVSEIQANLISSSDAAICGVDSQQMIFSSDATSVKRYDLSKPSIQQATYKLNISGEGPVKIDGTTIIPSGKISTSENYVDSNVVIDGNCFISGVRVK